MTAVVTISAYDQRIRTCVAESPEEVHALLDAARVVGLDVTWTLPEPAADALEWLERLAVPA